MILNIHKKKAVDNNEDRTIFTSTRLDLGKSFVDDGKCLHVTLGGQTKRYPLAEYEYGQYDSYKDMRKGIKSEARSIVQKRTATTKAKSGTTT